MKNTYVFFNEGEGYTAEKGEEYVLTSENGKYRICIDMTGMLACKGIRIDLEGRACAVKINHLEVRMQNCYKKIPFEDMVSNGLSMEKGILIFEESMPQIFLNVPWKEQWLKLSLEYEVLSYEPEALKAVLREHEKEKKEYREQIEACKQELRQMRHEYDFSVLQIKKDYGESYIQTVQSYEEKSQKLKADCQQQVADSKEREVLLKDKLNYIQGTKVYRMFLKKKVDALGLWKNID